MPLSTKVNIGQGDVFLDGVAAPLKGAQPPVFGSCLLWPYGWMDEDATWYRSRPRPRPHCFRRGTSSSRKGHSSPPHLFGPCLLWPRSSTSATVGWRKKQGDWPLTEMFSMAWWCNNYRTLDSRLKESRFDSWAVPLSGNNLRQVVQTHVSLSSSSINCYRSKGDDALRLGR